MAKTDGGETLITLVDSLLRLWPRAMRPISRAWIVSHGSPHSWGNRRGYSSTYAAYEHNLQAEVAHHLGEHAITIVVDMWKCFETVLFPALMNEAQHMSFPLRLLWLLLETYAQPRVIRAYGCWSIPTRALQGILAGCTHATTLLTVLTYRAVVKVHTHYRDVIDA